ncbi:uncharacterized protein LOC107365655 [Tetranychus urticae]|uniref:Uncharacterized protein n=1 Tax=Tetranychus urticae TaxID=32264 RepID=T1KN43_TETUR|nr:uncharacterized protein LOC107365655 [Tetranychus urticae]
MEEQKHHYDKITFKVKHLNEYHDIVIDPNDARYEYKDQHLELFEQLESITGVPSRYTTAVYILRIYNLTPVNNAVWYLWGIFNNQKAFAPNSQMEYYPHQDIFSLNIRDGQRFYLQYGVSYAHRISKRLSICYYLVEEIDVPEEGCGVGVCQSNCTESYFKRLKDLVNNDELNAKITQLVQPLFESGTFAEAHKIFREFNVKQYLYPVCDLDHRWRLAENGHARQDIQYLRTRG